MGNWTPSIVPDGRSRTVYLVLNDFGKLGRAYLETGEDETDLETIISRMLEGQYSNPVDVFAFNAAEEWVRDVSEYVADEIRSRCDRQGIDIPAELEAFMEQPRKSRPRPATSCLREDFDARHADLRSMSELRSVLAEDAQCS